MHGFKWILNGDIVSGIGTSAAAGRAEYVRAAVGDASDAEEGAADVRAAGENGNARIVFPYNVC